MVSRLCPLLRNLHPPAPSLSGDGMAVRVLPRAIPSTYVVTVSASSRSHFRLSPTLSRLSFPTSSIEPSSIFERRFGNGPGRKEFSSWSFARSFGRVLAHRREYRKNSRRPVKRKGKELDLSVKICIEEQLPDDPEVLDIAEMLRLNVPMALKLALDGLKDSEYKTRDTAIGDVGCFESIELSVLLCNDEFIRALNKEWRDEDKPTDVLSMSQHIPELKIPILMLGDIVISVETAAKQAEERGHTLLDEIRILLGLLVYGRQGREISRRNLDPNVCREACLYSLKHKVPLIAFSEDRCLTLFDHPSVESLHTIYYEPKAEIIPSVEQLLAGVEIQKMIFLDTAEGVASTLRPYWMEATGEYASVVQAVPDMLEIVPSGTSKGKGVQMLLDHLGVSPNEIMAIGDGENDMEMLELASLGVALSNGSEKAKAVANVIGSSNDEDGAADAIYRYAF
nr:endoribonuclease YBEY, chloroplastic [Ipomoea batatas]